MGFKRGPNSEKTGQNENTAHVFFFCPILQLRGFWQDGSVRENGAQLHGPRVSNFLSHRIVKSSIFMIFGKLEIQCTRNGHQNPPFCPGSPQNTFIFLRYFKTRFFKLIVLKSNIWKSENLKVWQRRASKNNRDLSSQKCFNFRGVLIGDKTDCKTDTWELKISLGNCRMGTFAPGSQAWGTGLLRLGEPVGGSWGNPGGRLPWPGL